MLKIGKDAPKFEGKAYHKGNFVDIKLDDYKGKWVVLVFYPGDFTFVCPTELEGFAKLQEMFEKENAVIIAASTDSEHSHKAWFERDLKEVKYPVLADTSHRISQDYDVLAPDGSSERGTFVISPEGILKYIVVSDSNVGRSVEETLRVLKALKTGGLCPVHWVEGDATIEVA